MTAHRFQQRILAPVIVSAEDNRVFVRNDERERDFLQDLLLSDMSPCRGSYFDDWDVEFPNRVLSKVVDRLVSGGWIVESSGKKIHRATDWSLNVSSGVDWFELNGKFEFGERIRAIAGPAEGDARG